MTVIKMPNKQLLDAKGKPATPLNIVPPPDEGWSRNPTDPTEHVKTCGALALSVRQNHNPKAGPPAALVVMCIPENTAAATPFMSASDAFMFANVIANATDYMAVPRDELQPKAEDTDAEVYGDAPEGNDG
ncbi:MAG: hypothetical protein ACK5MY_02400 [Jhaorihella sp.]